MDYVAALDQLLGLKNVQYKYNLSDIGVNVVVIVH